jgi:hypothetical protein
MPHLPGSPHVGSVLSVHRFGPRTDREPPSPDPRANRSGGGTSGGGDGLLLSAVAELGLSFGSTAMSATCSDFL